MELEYGGRRVTVAAGGLVIGSGSEAGLVLAGPGVLARHAVVRLLGDGMVSVVPAGPGARVLVNGASVGSDPTPVMHGDKIGIGGTVVTVADPRRMGATQVIEAAGAPAPASGAPARLVSQVDGREYTLARLPFSIGRDPGAALVVQSGEVSRLHAEIVQRPDGQYLVDHSSNGCAINGKRVAGEARLARGDLIRVGSEELRYYPGSGAPAGAAPPQVAPAAVAPELGSLLIRSGIRKGDRLVIRAPVVHIGRAEYNDLTLPDPSVSASHAKLQLREGIWVLTELGSTNGTMVDDAPVTGEAPLSPGATVTIGEVRLLFEPKDKGGTAHAGTVVFRPPAPAAPAVVPPAPAAPRPMPRAPALAPPKAGPARGLRPLFWTLVLLAAALLLVAFWLLG